MCTMGNDNAGYAHCNITMGNFTETIKINITSIVLSHDDGIKQEQVNVDHLWRECSLFWYFS